MGLLSTYVVAYGQIPKLFEKIREGQAPPKFTQQYLKDIGLGSSNFRSVISLLKGLGFLSNDGTPTKRYHDYRGAVSPAKILGESLKDSYSDIFTIKSKPTKNDKELIVGKFKSAFNTNDRIAGLIASTFFALLDISDIDTTEHTKSEEAGSESLNRTTDTQPSGSESRGDKGVEMKDLGFHYNIQIHLPATKDIEVYSAIFRALKENLVD